MRSARYQADTDESSGQDSFLDIVANIVGILILLVMVVGVRAARRPDTGSTDLTPPAAEADPQASRSTPQAEPSNTPVVDVAAEAREAERRALLAQKDAQEFVVRAVQARKEIAEQDSLRVHLAALVTQTEEQLEEKRQELARDKRDDYDNRIAIAEAQRRLDELTREQAGQFAEEEHVETVESLPTPIARRVDENEFYVVLSGGRASVLPLDALRVQLRARLGAGPLNISGRNSLSFVVGPVGGYRLRFLVQRVSVPASLGGRVATRQLWEVVPSEDLISEPVDQAILEGSALMTSLAAYSRRDTTITIITYADSFDEFRTLKKRLYELGYPVAGRPMPVGEPIIGSPQGTRSAAQ